MLYTVYFEIFGKKMKTKIKADSIKDAKVKIIGKIDQRIVWGEIIPEITDDGTLDRLMDMFKMK